MKRLLVLYMLESITLFGCGTQRERVLQLIPSPNGAYRAVALDCRKDKNERTTLLKVIRADEEASCEARSVQEVTCPSGLQPRIAWMSDNALLIDERGAPSRPTMQGEVSFVFSPWQATASSLDSMDLADVGVPTKASVASTPTDATAVPADSPAGQNDNFAASPPASVAPSEDRPEEAHFRGVRPVKTPPVEPACGFPGLTLPTDFSVLAGGAYEGKKSSVRIDQSGQAATTMSVSVDNPQKPVVLMLGAYAPTIWSIRRSPGTTILAVLASGTHRQVVTGLDATTPVAIHTKDNESPCGSFHVDMRYLHELNPVALRFFAREIDMAYLAVKGVLSMGISPGKTSMWVGRGDAPAESYIDKTPLPLSGEAALDDAVRKGLLRRANEGDMNKWEAKLARLTTRRGASRGARGMPTPCMDWPFRLSDAYVVRRAMEFPAGLYGSQSAVFFVPKGTERPRGDPGHSMIFDFNDMSCTGTMCRLCSQRGARPGSLH